MKTWVLECDGNERSSWISENQAKHPGSYDITPGDRIYLYDTDAGSVIGTFEALATPPTTDSPARTPLSRPENALQEVDVEDISESLEAGLQSEDVVTTIELAFRFDGEPYSSSDQVEIDNEPESHQHSRTGIDKDDTDGLALGQLVTEGRGANGEDFSNAQLPDGQPVENLNFRGCDFSEANLTGVKFVNVDLRDTDFRSANLEGATFKQTKLDGANFTDAVLSGAVFKTDVTACDFTNAQLKEADFRKATLEMADFSKARLKRANFRGTRPRRAVFDDALMSDFRASNAVFKRASFQNASIANTNFHDAAFHDVDFTNADLQNTKFGDTDLEDTVFTGADLEEADFTGLEADGLDFSNADLSEATLSDVSFEAARFTDSRATNATFEEAELAGATFVGVKADEANFDSANLEYTTFSQADLFEADFSNTALYGSHLSSARIGKETEFDDKCIYESDPDGVTNSDSVPLQEKAASVYRTLESVSRENALSSESLRYLYRRKEARRRALLDEGPWERTVGAYILKYLTGYGVRVRYLLGWATGVIIISAIIYGTGGFLVHDSIGRLQFGMTGTSFIEMSEQVLMFSILSFTALGYGSFEPTGLGEWLSILDAGFGLLFFALIVFVITVRTSR